MVKNICIFSDGTGQMGGIRPDQRLSNVYKMYRAMRPGPDSPISPMDQVYEGQVIGEHTRQNDITVNVTKAKQLTNMRASGSDDKTSIAPPKLKARYPASVAMHPKHARRCC